MTGNNSKTQLHLFLGLMSGQVYNWLHQATSQLSSGVCPGFIVLCPLPFVPTYPLYFPTTFWSNTQDPANLQATWFLNCCVWTNKCMLYNYINVYIYNILNILYYIYVCVCVQKWNIQPFDTNCISFWGLTCKVWSGFPGSCWFIKAPGGSFRVFPRKECWQVDLGRCVAFFVGITLAKQHGVYW